MKKPVSCHTHCSWALPRQRNLKMLQRVTLNVLQVFQRIFDAINPCIIIYEYINIFLSVFLFFIFIVVYGGVMVVKNVRKQKIFLLLLDKLLCLSCLHVLHLHVCCKYKTITHGLTLKI